MKNLKKNCRAKKRFIAPLTDKNISDRESEYAFNVWKKFGMRTIKDYHGLYLKCDFLLLADVFKKSENNSLKIMDYVYGIISVHQV